MDQLEFIAKAIGFIGTISGAVAVLVKCLKEQAKIREGQKCQLRTDMLSTYHKNKE